MVALFFSSAAGLIYPILWARQLTLALGNSALTITALVAAIMAGLGLGSGLAARYVDQLPPRKLTRLFSLLEAGMAALGIALPTLLQLLTPLLVALSGTDSSSAILSGLLCFSACVLLFLVPTSLMGATFPVMANLLGSSSADPSDVNGGAQNSSETAGSLFGANTWGAAAGLAAGVLLLYVLGRSPSIGLAFLLNFAAAAIVALKARKENVEEQLETDESKPKKSKVKAQDKDTTQETLAPWVVATVMVLSGTAATASVTAWVRALVLLMGPTTYGPALVVSSVLAGIALGSAASSRWIIRNHRPASLLAALQILAALSSWIVIPILGQLPVPVGELIRSSADRIAWLIQVELLWVFLLLIVPSFLLGSVFPLAVRLYRPSVRKTGTAAGNVYAWSLAGAAYGSLFTGLLFLPWLGMEAVLYLAAMVHVLAGILILLAATRKAIRLVSAVAALGASVLAPFVLPSWDRELFSGGTYRYAAHPDEGEILDFLRRGQLVFYREDGVATVSVKQVGSENSLAVNGRVIATNAGDMLTQRLVAHVPLLLHPEPRRVCVIGYGSGVTGGSALTHPIESLDAVEISPGVIEGSRWFARENNNALDDERLELSQTDGRNHLLRTDRRYDVIASIPSNPWMSGFSRLFTREFFALAHKRLEPGGVFCQRVPIDGMATDDLKTIVAGFTDAFPQSALFLISEGDVLLVGAESDLPEIDSAVLDRRIGREPIAEDLANVEVRNLFTLASLYALETPELSDWSADADRHTDDHPILEFRAPRFMYADTGVSNHNSILEVAREAARPEAIQRLLASSSIDAVLSRARMLEKAESFRWAFETYADAARLAPDRLEAFEGIVRTALAIEQPQSAEETLREFSPVSGESYSVGASIGLGLLYRNLGRHEESLTELTRAIRTNRQSFRALLLAAEVEGEIGHVNLMENHCRTVLELEHDHPEAGALLAEAAMRREESDLALSRAFFVLDQHPDQMRALQVVAVTYAQIGNIEEARSRFKHLIELEPDGWLHYNNFAHLEMTSNRFPAAVELYEKAVDLNPHNVEGYIGLKNAAQMTGDSKRLERAESMLEVLRARRNRRNTEEIPP
jgi:spermidine synthase